jgi:hypothetical protein
MHNVIAVRHGFSGFVKIFGLLRYSESNSLPVSIGNTYKGRLDGSSPVGSANLIILSSHRIKIFTQSVMYISNTLLPSFNFATVI